MFRNLNNRIFFYLYIFMRKKLSFPKILILPSREFDVVMNFIADLFQYNLKKKNRTNRRQIRKDLHDRRRHFH